MASEMATEVFKEKFMRLRRLKTYRKIFSQTWKCVFPFVISGWVYLEFGFWSEQVKQKVWIIWLTSNSKPVLRSMTEKFRLTSDYINWRMIKKCFYFCRWCLNMSNTRILGLPELWMIHFPTITQKHFWKIETNKSALLASWQKFYEAGHRLWVTYCMVHLWFHDMDHPWCLNFGL